MSVRVRFPLPSTELVKCTSIYHAYHHLFLNSSLKHNIGDLVWPFLVAITSDPTVPLHPSDVHWIRTALNTTTLPAQPAVNLSTSHLVFLSLGSLSQFHPSHWWVKSSLLESFICLTDWQKLKRQRVPIFVKILRNKRSHTLLDRLFSGHKFGNMY